MRVVILNRREAIQGEDTILIVEAREVYRCLNTTHQSEVSKHIVGLKGINLSVPEVLND